MTTAAERILGHMQVANEQVRIVEAQFPIEQIVEFHRKWAPQESFLHPDATAITWAAFIPSNYGTEEAEKFDHMVAFAVLDRSGSDTAILRWLVAPEYRSVGIGKLMARFATDEAIRYRLRKIQCFVDAENKKAIQILEMEEFEEVCPRVIIGRLHMEKVLKWM